MLSIIPWSRKTSVWMWALQKKLQTPCCLLWQVIYMQILPRQSQRPFYGQVTYYCLWMFVIPLKIYCPWRFINLCTGKLHLKWCAWSALKFRLLDQFVQHHLAMDLWWQNTIAATANFLTMKGVIGFPRSLEPFFFYPPCLLCSQKLFTSKYLLESAIHDLKLSRALGWAYVNFVSCSCFFNIDVRCQTSLRTCWVFLVKKLCICICRFSFVLVHVHVHVHVQAHKFCH